MLVIALAALAAPGMASAHGMMGRPGMLPDWVNRPQPAAECWFSRLQGRLICEPTGFPNGRPSFEDFDNLNFRLF